ncbi:hypothetical protein [Thermaerobacter subterraneus]|uniref:Uncharacterized protein n=1 Tax=Thermaerobacter subterraneus DSM 13965 TaxID=867903 RepID=K6PZL1_9FIRM|nr:hypothetical protein [Thermaerobacter subterraneus]EKP94248.1 hypothetical protein ThesuDRAFT_01980 [Thermaerobacter subterraneus DSM 13965]
MPGRRSRTNPWITVAILVALLAGAGYGWWRTEGDGAGPSGPGPAVPGGGNPAPGAGPDPADEPAVPDPAPAPGGEGAAAANPLWPFIQPVDLTAGAGLLPRPVAMESEGTAGILAVDGDALWFAGAAGDPVRVFQLPPGHRWASPVVPSPAGDAVAFLTRAEAGTPYLWVVHSDLTSTPHPVPRGLDRPGSLAWAGPGTVVAGDPPFQLEIEPGRWSRLPGAGLIWAGPPSPTGRWWVYGAAAEEGGAGPDLYLVDHQGGARPLELAGGEQPALPGPWLAEDRFLAALGEPVQPGEPGERAGPAGAGPGPGGGAGAGSPAGSAAGSGTAPAPGSTGSAGEPAAGPAGGPAAAPVVQQLVVVDAGTGEKSTLFDAPPGERWQVVAASPGGRWVVLAPVAGQGGWRLLDTVSGRTRDLPSGVAAAGAVWGGGTWLFYLAPDPAAGAGALRLVAHQLPSEEAEPETGEADVPLPGSWPTLRPQPAAVRRLLAVDPAAGVAWVELVPAGAAAPAAARWVLLEGRLEPVRGRH